MTPWSRVLGLVDDLEAVAEVGDGGGVVDAALATGPDVAVVDVDLPGMDGLAVAAVLRERLPEGRVLILTALALPGKPATLFLPRNTSVLVSGNLDVRSGSWSAPPVSPDSSSWVATR